MKDGSIIKASSAHGVEDAANSDSVDLDMRVANAEGEDMSAMPWWKRAAKRVGEGYVMMHAWR